MRSKPKPAAKKPRAKRSGSRISARATRRPAPATKKPGWRLLEQLLPGMARKFGIRTGQLRAKLQSVLGTRRPSWRYVRLRLTSPVRSAFGECGIENLPDTAMVFTSNPTIHLDRTRNLIAILPDTYKGACGAVLPTVRVISVTRDTIPLLFWDDL